MEQIEQGEGTGRMIAKLPPCRWSAVYHASIWRRIAREIVRRRGV